MRCPDSTAFVDLLYEEVEPGACAQLLAHLEDCGQCGERWRRLRALSESLDRWDAPQPPRGIAERALARVATERARKAERTQSDVSPERIMPRVLLGAGAALVSLLLVAGIAERQVAPLTIGVLGVVWTVLYAGVLLARSHPQLRAVAGPALAGAGITMILAPVLSIPSVVEACARWIQAAPASLAFALVLTLLAAGYTAGPLLLGGLVFGRSTGARPLADGATLSVLYALLIAPAVYLQCLTLPLNVTAVWMAGGIVGAGLAGPASLGLVSRRTRAA